VESCDLVREKKKEEKKKKYEYILKQGLFQELKKKHSLVWGVLIGEEEWSKLLSWVREAPSLPEMYWETVCLVRP
jgi:adenosine deaminase